jgi:hypothetical protein
VKTLLPGRALIAALGGWLARRRRRAAVRAAITGPHVTDINTSGPWDDMYDGCLDCAGPVEGCCSGGGAR